MIPRNSKTIPLAAAMHQWPAIVNHPVPHGLGDFVERAVTVDYNHAVGGEWLVLPSGCFGLRAILSDSHAAHDGLGPLDNSLLVSGVMPTAFQSTCRRPNAVLAVALTPLGAAVLPVAATDLNEMADAIAIDVLGPARPVQLRHRLAGTASLAAKADVYLGWLEDLFQSLRPAHGRRLALAELASQMRLGNVASIEDAARRVGVSRRQLERDFLLQMGMTPKTFSRVATFQRFAQRAWLGEPLAQIAAGLDLTDQSHLTHVVKSLAGLTPAALLKRASQSELSRLTRPHWGGRITYL